MILLAAYKAELSPLVNALGLKKVRGSDGVVQYANTMHQAFIIGSGEIAVTHALTRIFQLIPDLRATIFLNIGIAGQSLCSGSSIGQLVWVNKVLMPDGQTSYELTVPEQISGEQITVQTVRAPVSPDTYLTEHHKLNAEQMMGKVLGRVYDMELAYVASCLGAQEKARGARLLSAKVISDNHAADWQGLTPQRASELIGEQKESLVEMIEYLSIYQINKSNI